MQAEKTDHMKDALAARRGKGLELIIGIGHPDGPMGPDHQALKGPHEGGPMSDDERKIESGRGDLAPPLKGEGDVLAEHMSEHPDHLDALEDADLIKEMTDHDKQDLIARKPRSLSERARQFAFNKK